MALTKLRIVFDTEPGKRPWRLLPLADIGYRYFLQLTFAWGPLFIEARAPNPFRRTR
jgi:hypothetical protein